MDITRTGDSGALRVTTLAQGWPDDRPGGLNRYVADLHAGLGRAGVDEELVVFGPAASAPGRVRRAVPEDSGMAARLLSTAREGVASGRGSAVVVSHFAMYGLLPSLVLRLTRRTPLVAHFHGPWAGESASSGAGRASAAAKQLVERVHVRSAAAVVTASRAFGQLVQDVHGVPASRVHPIHPGVDLDRFHPLPEPERAALRRRLGVPDSGRLVVTARRLVPRMGIDVLLQAWPGGPDDRLVVVGDGPSRAALEAEAARLGRPGVVFAGRVDEEALVAHYQAADAVVVPSTALEGFGLVVLEALACGTPVVASDLGGLSEVLPGLDPTLMVPPDDVPALRERLQAALAGDLPDRAACRATAQEHSREAFAAAVAAVYRQVAAEAAERGARRASRRPAPGAERAR